MLPGFAIADMLFAAQTGAGRSDAARASGGEAGDFEALLQGSTGEAAQPEKSTPRGTGADMAGRVPDGQAADNAETAQQAAPASRVVLPDMDNPEIPEGAADAPIDAQIVPEDGAELENAAPGDNAAPESPALPGGVPRSTRDNPGDAVNPDTQLGADAANAGEEPVLPAAPASGAQVDEPDANGAPDGKADGAKSAGAEPVAPAAPANDGAPQTGNPAQQQGGEPPVSPPTQQAQPKADTAQPPAAPASPPGPGSTPAGEAGAPEKTQATASAAQQAKADIAAQPARADGEAPNAAAIRREMERGNARGSEGPELARTVAEKAESGTKDAPATQRTAMTAPAAASTPAPAGTAQPAIPATQSMAAMLTALQSGLASPETRELGQSSEGGEIRLESSSALLARNESASVAGTRTTAALPHLRMASGHVAELGQMIARRFADGSRSFDIRLDPPDLGRVQVRLEIGADRSVQAMLTADKPEALAELQRNARELEKALADAGLELGENGIGFALSEGGGDDDRSAGHDDGSPAPAITSNLTISEESAPAPASRYGFLMTGRTGVDMRI